MPLVDATAIAAIEVVLSKPKEKERYDPFITAMKRYLNPAWSLVNTSATDDPTSYLDSLFGGHRNKPDLTLYPYIEEDAGIQYTPFAPKAECFGEFKTSEADEPYTNLEAVSIESSTSGGMATRDQIARYSTAIQATQFRTRVFTFYVLDRKARLISHSRLGMEVTPLFDWTTAGHFLHQFFWRLSHADREYRGYDTTFRPVSSSDIPDVWNDVRAGLLSQHSEKDDPTYEVQVKNMKLYVSSPFTNSHVYPVGRGTRCFSAYDPVQNRLVLLKHTWRDVAYLPEHEIYEKLKAHHVRNIPNFIVASDMTGCFAECQSARERTQRLYCIVLDVIGQSLTRIISSYELIQVISDCVEAHHDAAVNASVLHRDMSVGNMIVVEDKQGAVHGMLIDWERALVTNAPNMKVSTERTGTWQFLSVRLLRSPAVRHEVQDDMESVIYIIIWMSIRYLKNTLSAKARFDLLNLLFDYRHSSPEAGKENMAIGGRQWVFKLRLSGAAVFKDLLRDLLDALRHNALDVEDWEEDWTTDEATNLKQRLHTHKWMRERLANFLANHSMERDGRRNSIQATKIAGGSVHNERLSESIQVLEEGTRKRNREEERRRRLQSMEDDDAYSLQDAEDMDLVS